MEEITMHKPTSYIWFSGWKEHPHTVTIGGAIYWWPSTDTVIRNGARGIESKFYYCFLPSMRVDILGHSEEYGLRCDLSKGVSVITADDELRRIFADGLHKLVDIVVKDNPTWLDDMVYMREIKSSIKKYPMEV